VNSRAAVRTFTVELSVLKLHEHAVPAVVCVNIRYEDTDHGPCIYRAFVFLIHSGIQKNEKPDSTAFVQLPPLARNATNGLRTNFRIPYCMQECRRPFVFRFFCFFFVFLNTGVNEENKSRYIHGPIIPD